MRHTMLCITLLHPWHAAWLRAPCTHLWRARMTVEKLPSPRRRRMSKSATVRLSLVKAGRGRAVSQWRRQLVPLPCRTDMGGKGVQAYNLTLGHCTPDARADR